jgi:photosystem I subunit 6
MASLAAAVSVQPVAVKGLAGSSISGRKLAVARPSARAACRSTRRAAVVAKYGDKSVYFDLEDIGNTTGQWDLYGSDAPSPYNPLQVMLPIPIHSISCS